MTTDLPSHRLALSLSLPHSFYLSPLAAIAATATARLRMLFSYAAQRLRKVDANARPKPCAVVNTTSTWHDRRRTRALAFATNSVSPLLAASAARYMQSVSAFRSSVSVIRSILHAKRANSAATTTNDNDEFPNTIYICNSRFTDITRLSGLAINNQQSGRGERVFVSQFAQ